MYLLLLSIMMMQITVNIVLKLESTQALRPEQKENMELITKAMFSVVAEVSVSIDTEKQVRYK